MSEAFDQETGELVVRPRVERIERSAELGEFFAAMAKAQGAIKTALKTGTNPHFRSKYAKIDAVIEASQEPLAANGLCCMQLPVDLSGRIAVTTMLGHSSGQYIASTLSYPLERANIQTMGSAITYLSRYSRVAILGIAPEDDDGEAAVGRQAAVGPAGDLDAFAATPIPPAPAPKHVGAFSKDQEPPESPRTGNGQERPATLREKIAQKSAEKRAAAPPVQPPAPEPLDPPLVTEAKKAAEGGWIAARAWWNKRSQEDIDFLKPYQAEIQRIARQADEAAKGAA